MQSGLTRLSYSSIGALLLIPLVLSICLQLGTRNYCTCADQMAMAQRTTLAQIADLEFALRQAQANLHTAMATATLDFSELKAFDRWMRDVAEQQHIKLQKLTLKTDSAAPPLIPAFTATFRTEQPWPQLLLLLQTLQQPSRLVVFDSLLLRPSTPGEITSLCLVDITLHTYALTNLSILSTELSPASAPDSQHGTPDHALITTAHQVGTTVMRLASVATNSADWSTRLLTLQAQEQPAPASTNAPAPIPPPAEPVFELRGMSCSAGRPMALLNGHWVTTGDRLMSTGHRVSRIENNHVILVDTQGVMRVVTFCLSNRK